MRDDFFGEKLSPEEKERAMLEAQLKRERMERTGQIIVITIASVNIIFALITLILGTSCFIVPLWQIAVSIALVYGKTWARILFIIGFGLSIIFTLFVASQAAGLGLSTGTGLVVFLALSLIYNIVGGVLLFASESVKEYMYSVKNG